MQTQPSPHCESVRQPETVTSTTERQKTREFVDTRAAAVVVPALAVLPQPAVVAVAVRRAGDVTVGLPARAVVVTVAAAPVVVALAPGVNNIIMLGR